MVITTDIDDDWPDDEDAGEELEHDDDCSCYDCELERHRDGADNPEDEEYL